MAFAAHRRTQFTITVGGDTVKTGEVASDDPSGLQAFEVAAQWASDNYPGVSFVWKHSRGDKTGRSPRRP